MGYICALLEVIINYIPQKKLIHLIFLEFQLIFKTNVFCYMLPTYCYRNYFELYDPGLIDLIEKHKFHKKKQGIKVLQKK